jgi:hypothetical protein
MGSAIAVEGQRLRSQLMEAMFEKVYLGDKILDIKRKSAFKNRRRHSLQQNKSKH